MTHGPEVGFNLSVSHKQARPESFLGVEPLSGLTRKIESNGPWGGARRMQQSGPKDLLLSPFESPRV
jgi:hypothetical protein